MTGTKTVVKCSDEDDYDPEKGLAMAIAKHYLGTNKSKGNYYDVFRKWLPEEDVTYRDMKKEIIKAYALKEVIFECLKQLGKEEESSKDETDGD